DEYAALAEDRVGLGCGRSVGAFDDQRRFDVAGVARRELIPDGRRHQQVAVHRKDILVADLLRARETTERLLASPILEHTLDGKAKRVVDAAVVLADRNHRAARLFEKTRANAADVAKALYRNLRLMGLAAEMVQRSQRADRDAAPSGLDAAKRTADLDRLARDGCRHG